MRIDDLTLSCRVAVAEQKTTSVVFGPQDVTDILALDLADLRTAVRTWAKAEDDTLDADRRDAEDFWECLQRRREAIAALRALVDCTKGDE